MRRGGQKVRTGCRTCKTRKVKCDETKPACVRCSSTSRKCGGYDLGDLEQDGPAAFHRAISLYRPKLLTAHDEKEGRSFHFFSHVVGPVLAGSMDTYFWTHLVMQFSHFTPAVRHAAIAISALYEDFVRGSRINRPRRNVLALKHYNAAIQEVSVKPAQDEQLVLMVCLLFVCVELLQGDPEAATRHCQCGIAILEKFKINSERSPSPWVVQHMLPIFRRLSLSLFSPVAPPAALSPASIMFQENGPDGGCVPDRFNTIIEASNSLDQLSIKCVSIRGAKGDHQGQERQHEKMKLQVMLRLWSARVWDFESSYIDFLQPAEMLALCNMRMKCEREQITLDVGMGPKSFAEEVKYDQYLYSFKSMVGWARRASELMAPPLSTPLDNTQRPSFSFEMGFLALLLFVVLKCRHFETRLEALSWMPHLSAAKESMLDLGTVYRFGRRVIELEHNISLDDELCPCDGETAKHQLGPKDRRIMGVPVDHEMEVLTGEDGIVSYRRTVTFLMKDADDTMSPRREYLRDSKLRQFDLDIPGMRSAR